MNTDLPWMACYDAANCAANVFAQQRTSKHPEPSSIQTRRFLRRSAVATLRYLWRTGSPEQRAVVANRVKGWMDSGCDWAQIRDYGARILAREEARVANAKPRHEGNVRIVAGPSQLIAA